MNTTSIARRFQFCAGHRVLGHENKCGHLHGHNYVAMVHVRSPMGWLDKLGRVVDFSVVKEKVGGWIDSAWDHGMVLNVNDPLVMVLGAERGSDGSPMKLYATKENPTAEVMARELLQAAQRELSRHMLEVWRVELWETENCVATYDESHQVSGVTGMPILPPDFGHRPD